MLLPVLHCMRHWIIVLVNCFNVLMHIKNGTEIRKFAFICILKCYYISLNMLSAKLNYAAYPLFEICPLPSLCPPYTPVTTCFLGMLFNFYWIHIVLFLAYTHKNKKKNNFKFKKFKYQNLSALQDIIVVIASICFLKYYIIKMLMVNEDYFNYCWELIINKMNCMLFTHQMRSEVVSYWIILMSVHNALEKNWILPCVNMHPRKASKSTSWYTVIEIIKIKILGWTIY